MPEIVDKSINDSQIWGDSKMSEQQTVQPWLDQAVSLAQKGRFTEALQTLQHGIDAHPRQVPLREHLIGLAVRCGHYPLAIDEAMDCAQLHLELNQRERAIHWYETILRLEETCQLNPQTTPDQVQELRQRVAQVKAEIYFNIGDFQRENGKLDTALQYLRKATELSPGDGLFHLGLARSYQSLEKHKEAIGEFQEVIRMASWDKGVMAQAYEGLGEVFVAQGRPPQATTTWFQRAAEYFERAGQSDQARRVYTRLLEVDPECQETRQKLQELTPMPAAGPNQDESGTRLRQLERTLLDRPDDPGTLNEQGDCLLAMQRLSEAAACFERVLHLLQPHQQRARQNLVQIYRQLGQSELAARHQELLGPGR